MKSGRDRTDREESIAKEVATREFFRWVDALVDLGCSLNPGLSPKENIADFVGIKVKAERERCAKIAENHWGSAQEIAADIRKSGE